jgi:hypothetical protein
MVGCVLALCSFLTQDMTIYKYNQGRCLRVFVYLSFNIASVWSEIKANKMRERDAGAHREEEREKRHDTRERREKRKQRERNL